MIATRRWNYFKTCLEIVCCHLCDIICVLLYIICNNTVSTGTYVSLTYTYIDLYIVYFNVMKNSNFIVSREELLFCIQ